MDPGSRRPERGAPIDRQSEVAGRGDLACIRGPLRLLPLQLAIAGLQGFCLAQTALWLAMPGPLGADYPRGAETNKCQGLPCLDTVSNRAEAHCGLVGGVEGEKPDDDVGCGPQGLRMCGICPLFISTGALLSFPILSGVPRDHTLPMEEEGENRDCGCVEYVLSSSVLELYSLFLFYQGFLATILVQWRRKEKTEKKAGFRVPRDHTRPMEEEGENREKGRF
ncbi:hypothetical protein NDU88_004812 [Pleurodeles waltl]|uniref:Uncharacterized protein n=1 Tax=Pleurodeles waltl TaxID=8319 RepID=A0AAV7LJG4_PLEWA|nr:hypothetical protein NDU88_004812 [Pleurodeles waltl]